MCVYLCVATVHYLQLCVGVTRDAVGSMWDEVINLVLFHVVCCSESHTDIQKINK